MEKSIKYLQQNALWVIMDPWYKTPYQLDVLKFPGIDEHNEKTIKKIVEYIPKLNHICVSCPPMIMEKNKSKLVDVHPKLRHLKNFYNSYSNLKKYMDDENLEDIVYCGFHYGQCILYKHDGAKNTSKKYNVWVKKNLCSVFPEELSIEEYDKMVEKYATII